MLIGMGQTSFHVVPIVCPDLIFQGVMQRTLVSSFIGFFCSAHFILLESSVHCRWPIQHLCLCSGLHLPPHHVVHISCENSAGTVCCLHYEHQSWHEHLHTCTEDAPVLSCTAPLRHFYAILAPSTNAVTDWLTFFEHSSSSLCQSCTLAAVSSAPPV